MNADRGRQRDIRRVVFNAIGVVILLFVLLSAGCDKAMESYKDGVDLLAWNRYDEAVSKLDLACQQCLEKRNRDCTMFNEKLQYARRIAAEHYYGLAETALVETRLNDAKQHISKAIVYDPENAAYLKLREVILEHTLAGEGLRREALELAAQQQWDLAIETMEKAIGQYRSMPGAQGELAKIKKDAYNFYLAKARELFETGRWDEAISESNMALQYYSGSEAKEIIADIGNRRKGLELIEQAISLRASNGDGRAILDTLEKARQLYPSHPEIGGLIQEAKEAICNGLIAQAGDAINAVRYHEAMRLLHESDRLLKGYGGVMGKMTDVTMMIAQLHTDMGDSFGEGQKYGNAALHYLVAMNYVDNFPGARTGLSGAMAQLRESIKYSIGYVGFNCSWQDRNVTDSIESALLVHINKVRPGNIVIKDSTGFKTVLSGVNVNITDADMADVRIENSRPENTDALLMGQVLSKDFSVAEKVTHGRSKFQSGTAMEENPEYRNARVRFDAIFAEHEKAESNLRQVKIQSHKMMLPKTGDDAYSLLQRTQKASNMIAHAQGDLDRACVRLEKTKANLAHIPPHVAVPVISEYQYPIVHVTRTARINVFVKVVDSRTGAVLMAEKVDGSHSVSDSYVTPDSVHNVAGDALELPHDSIIMKQATDQILAKLYGVCDSYLANHSKRFVVTMNRARGEGAEEAAVEEGMRYLTSPRNGGNDRSQTIAFLKGVVAKRNENNATDLNKVLGKYYKP